MIFFRCSNHPTVANLRDVTWKHPLPAGLGLCMLANVTTAARWGRLGDEGGKDIVMSSCRGPTTVDGSLKSGKLTS